MTLGSAGEIAHHYRRHFHQFLDYLTINPDAPNPLDQVGDAEPSGFRGFRAYHNWACFFAGKAMTKPGYQRWNYFVLQLKVNVPSPPPSPQKASEKLEGALALLLFGVNFRMNTKKSRVMPLWRCKFSVI